MTQNRLYDEFAHLWPLISPPEEYPEEAWYWREALRDKLGPGRHEILELGVGGGHLLSHLTTEFQATAVDLSEKMMANSMCLNPQVEHHIGDMRSVRLDGKFKAVLIHDAIDYMLTESDLRATFATARWHMESGGVFIVCPDFFLETFPGTFITHKTTRSDDLELTYLEYSHDPDPTDTTIETVFFYFLKETGGLRIEQDRHVTGLFALDAWLNLMEEEGFDVEVRSLPESDEGHQPYLLIGVLRQQDALPKPRA